MSLPPLLPPSLPTVLFSPGRLKPSGFKSLPLFKGKKGKEGQGRWRFVGWVVLKDSWPQLTCVVAAVRPGAARYPGPTPCCPRALPRAHRAAGRCWDLAPGAGVQQRKTPASVPPPHPGGSVLGRVLPGSSEVPPGPLSGSRQEPALEHRRRCFPHFLARSPISSYFRINHLPPSLGLWSALGETPH